MFFRTLLGFGITYVLLFSCADNLSETKKTAPRETRPKDQSPKRATEPRKTNTEKSGINVPTVDPGALLLIFKQNNNFPWILNELTTQNKKSSDWIWWVFPTEKPGQSEDEPKTSVTVSIVDDVLAHANMDAWSAILEKIFELLKANPIGAWKNSQNEPNPDIIPSRDYGRIGFALNFWLDKVQEKTKKYPRFFNALTNLDKFKWPNR